MWAFASKCLQNFPRPYSPNSGLALKSEVTRHWGFSQAGPCSFVEEILSAVSSWLENTGSFSTADLEL